LGEALSPTDWRCASFRTAIQIEIEDPRNQHHGVRLVPILKHREADRRGAIDKNAAASAALVLHNPVPRAFWPIRKIEDLKHEGCSPCRIVILLDEESSPHICP